MVSLDSVSLVVLSLTQSYQCLGDIKYHWILMSPEFPRFSMEMFTPSMDLVWIICSVTGFWLLQEVFPPCFKRLILYGERH